MGHLNVSGSVAVYEDDVGAGALAIDGIVKEVE
jgi:hypothetical protein